jgi:hypothetical protein
MDSRPKVAPHLDELDQAPSNTSRRIWGVFRPVLPADLRGHPNTESTLSHTSESAAASLVSVAKGEIVKWECFYIRTSQALAASPGMD